MANLIKPQKLSDVILQKLEEMLAAGTWRAGQKLPSERELAVRFDVSRPSVREAIQKLEAKGMVVRRQGGGTYVQESQTSPDSPLLPLLNMDPETQFDLLEFRHTLEGMAAYYAALRAEKSEIDAIEQAFDQMQLAREKDYCAQARALAEFYMRLAEAAHNQVLLGVFKSLKAALQDNIERNLRMLEAEPASQARIGSQRKQILLAVKQGNPEAAREASNAHLAFIEQTLLDINRQDSRMQRALRRIEV